mmetsp:Transcript_8581/g.15196  ORF Transcript_8581/g.15196 Transcript_8581/m.15196 type:complete len:162 (+) Transcript_8581:428-913(+)
MRLQLGQDFPNEPPKGYFLTKIFHPNVSETGEICVNTLKRDWNAQHGLRHIFTVTRCLLIDPNPESALNEEAGKLLLENYEEFAAHAKIWTEIHAPASAATTNVASAVHASTSSKVQEDQDDGNSSSMTLSDNQNAPILNKQQSASGAGKKPAAKKSLKRL